MDKNLDTWEDYLEGALFTINTNESATTKYSPFYLMYGRHPRFPLEMEKNTAELNTSDDVATVMEELTSEVALGEHIEKLSRMKDALFPKVKQNIEKAQEKQQRQYQQKRGNPPCPFKDDDLVLQRNMLQKTKKGCKMQDEWIGPYKIVDLNREKGVCRLVNSAGKRLARLVSMKNLKLYQQSGTSNGSQLTTTMQSQATLVSGANGSLQSNKGCGVLNSQPGEINHPRPIPKPRTKLPPRMHH